jgi:membrane protein required for colicin V production
MPHTAADIAVIAVILISAVLAFIRGLTREAISLGTWLLAVYLAFTQYAHVAPYLADKISNESIRSLCAGVIIFVGVLLILLPIGFYLRGFVKGEQVTAIDRSLGFVFGAGRGYLLMSILYLIYAWLQPEEKQPDWLKEANTRPALVYGSDMIRKVIPAEQRALIEKTAKDTENAKNKVEEQLPTVEELKDAAPKKDSLDNKLNQLDNVIQNTTGQGQ